MVCLLLAAAVSLAAAKPLFVPPHGLHELKHDVLQAQHLRRSGYEFITEYRTTVHEQIGRLTVPRSIVISIGKASSYGMDAQAYGQARMQSWQSVRGIRILWSRPASICDGRRGWILAVTKSGSDDVVEQLFADGKNDAMYVAWLQYPKATGDMHAAKALPSLCPPPGTPVPAQTAPLPFALPPHWNAGDHSVASAVPPVVTQGVWLHFSATSRFIESLNLFKAPAIEDGITPQEYGEGSLSQMQQNFDDFQLYASAAKPLCGGAVSGWFISFSGVRNGNAVDMEQMTAYAKDATYMLQYVRRRGAAEDPHARKALFSLCPPSGQ